MGNDNHKTLALTTTRKITYCTEQKNCNVAWRHKLNPTCSDGLKIQCSTKIS